MVLVSAPSRKTGHRLPLGTRQGAAASSCDFRKWMNCLDALHELRLKADLVLAIRSARAVDYFSAVCCELVADITKGASPGKGQPPAPPEGGPRLSVDVSVIVRKNFLLLFC